MPGATAWHGRYPSKSWWSWRARRDSNPRPSAPEADALSAELRARRTAPMVPSLQSRGQLANRQPPSAAVTTMVPVIDGWMAQK